MKITTKTAVTKSWRTTLGGAIAGVGIILIGAALLPEQSYVQPLWQRVCEITGLGLNSLGVFLIGFNARDHKVSTGQALGADEKQL